MALFNADDGVHGRELWKTDGNGKNHTLKDINPGAGLTDISALTDLGNGKVLFIASPDDYAVDRYLWVTDGTKSGTLNLGKTYALDYNIIKMKNGLALIEGNDATNGRELWTTDGTLNGTRLLKDLYPGSASSGPRTSYKPKMVMSSSGHGKIWATPISGFRMAPARGLSSSRRTSREAVAHQ